MSATYQNGSNPTIDYVRLLIPDTDVTNAIFSDQEIMAAYAINTFGVFVSPGSGGVSIPVLGTPSYRWVAATLQDALAGNASRLGGMLQALDIKLDTRQVAKDLRDSAESLREVERNSGAFGIAEMCNSSFSTRERFFKQVLRLQA